MQTINYLTKVNARRPLNIIVKPELTQELVVAIALLEQVYNATLNEEGHHNIYITRSHTYLCHPDFAADVVLGLGSNPERRYYNTLDELCEELGLNKEDIGKSVEGDLNPWSEYQKFQGLLKQVETVKKSQL